MDEQERLAQLEKREAALREDRMRFELTQALSAARCRPEAVADATAIMLTQSAAEFDDSGRIAKLTVGGKAYEDLGAAAAAFLGARDYLVAAETKAKPEPAPTAADAWRADPKPTAPKGPAKPMSLDEAVKAGHSAGDLASLGWSQPPK